MDEPEVVYLTTRGAPIIVAVAIDSSLPDSMKFLGAEVSVHQWHRYLKNEADLRYLLKYPSYKKWFTFDLHDLSSKGEVLLHSVRFGDERYNRHLPAPGFFASSHTEIVDEPTTFEYTQSFEVDGSWSLQDFSRFYSKISDIYVFFSGLRSWGKGEVTVELRRRIREAFLHPWRGGFSYVAFFDGLLAAQPEEDRLSVRAVQYASPGHVDVDGHSDVFERVRGSLHDFGRDAVTARDRYNQIYNALSKGGYLRLDSREFLADDAGAPLFLQYARELGQIVGLNEIDTIHHLADENALVTLKIVMTLVRRTDDLFAFFAEGRAKLPGEDVVAATSDGPVH